MTGSTIMDSAKKYAWYGYIGCVLLATAYGAWGGTNNWVNWMSSRNKITVGYPVIDPVLNLGRDGGHMCYHLVTSGGTSAVVAAGFPVTVPVLTMMSKEVNNEHSD